MKKITTFGSWLLGILLISCQPASDSKTNTNTNTRPMTTNKNIDWQGHRGARGLMPENTIPAFIEALKYVRTLELDVCISKDKQVIVSHEPWFSAILTTKPDGQPVTEEEEKDLQIYQMTYEEIKRYDVGSRIHPRFPDQQLTKAHKPSFMEMVSNVELYCEKKMLRKPNYNIEIKSQPSYYDSLTPAPQAYVQYMLDEIDLLDIKSRVNLQSFDVNILNEIHRQDSTMKVAYLIEEPGNLDQQLALLDFKPHIYSPYYMLLNEDLIQKLHAKDILVIPWTVNEPEVMKRLVKSGVDGVITDYPNLIPE